MYKLLWQLLHVNDLQWFRAISHQHFTSSTPPQKNHYKYSLLRKWTARVKRSSSMALTAKHVSVLVVLPFLGVLFTLNSGNMLSRGTAHSLIRSASAGLNCKASLQTRGHFFSLNTKKIHLPAESVKMCAPARTESWIRMSETKPGSQCLVLCDQQCTRIPAWPHCPGGAIGAEEERQHGPISSDFHFESKSRRHAPCTMHGWTFWGDNKNVRICLFK